MGEPEFRLPRSIPSAPLQSIPVEFDFRPAPSTRLYLLLPQQYWIGPLEHPLLEILGADAPDLDRAAAIIGARFASLNGAAAAPDPKAERFAQEYRKRFQELRADYDRRTGPAKTYGPFRAEPAVPWRDINVDDVRACLFAAVTLLHRSGYLLSPAALMALWVIEGKRQRNGYYHEFAYLMDPPSPGGPIPNITALWRFNWYLARYLGNPAVAEAQKKQFPPQERQTHQTSFKDLTADEARYRWWAWSNMMPHFWSMDGTVLRFPGKSAGDPPVPPSMGGANLRNNFRAWLRDLRGIHALATDDDIQAILDYSSTSAGGFVVTPTEKPAQYPDQPAWPIRIKRSEAARVVALFLFLQGAFFSTLCVRIATRFGFDGCEVPDWPTYVAYNSASGVGKLGSPPTGADKRAQLLAAWEAPVLSAEDKKRFRSNSILESRVNAFRFLYIRDALAPIMDLPWRGE